MAGKPYNPFGEGPKQYNQHGRYKGSGNRKPPRKGFGIATGEEGNGDPESEELWTNEHDDILLEGTVGNKWLNYAKEGPAVMGRSLHAIETRFRKLSIRYTQGTTGYQPCDYQPGPTRTDRTGTRFTGRDRKVVRYACHGAGAKKYGAPDPEYIARLLCRSTAETTQLIHEEQKGVA